VFYEALAGRRPFEAEHPAAVLRSHLDSDPERPARIPDPVWDLVVRMMAKDPVNRPGAAAVCAYLADLADWISGAAAGDAPPDVPGSPTLPPFVTIPGRSHLAAPTPGETSEALGPLRLAQPPAAPEAAARPNRRRVLVAAGIGLLVLAAAGTGAGLALTGGHPKPKPTYGADVTRSVTVASNGTVTVRWTPVQAADFELLFISVRAGATGTPQPTVVTNTSGSYQVVGTPPGLHCFQALAYFTGPPPAGLSAPNPTKECLTVP
jgi:hypothetical protein